MAVGEPSHDLGGVVPRLPGGLGPRDEEEDDRCTGCRTRPSRTKPATAPASARRATPAASRKCSSAASRSRPMSRPKTTAMTMSHSAMATFLTQNDRNPFQANGAAERQSGETRRHERDSNERD